MHPTPPPRHPPLLHPRYSHTPGSPSELLLKILRRYYDVLIIVENSFAAINFFLEIKNNGQSFELSQKQGCLLITHVIHLSEIMQR